MRNEDIDWTVYHLITGEKGCTGDFLAEITGYERDVIHSSLSRLQRYCLIDCRDGVWSACRMDEIILKNQMKQFIPDGLEYSGGVIRCRPKDAEGDA